MPRHNRHHPDGPDLASAAILAIVIIGCLIVLWANS